MSSPRPAPQMLGRYALFDEIAAGGMATVHIGRLLGPAGFTRTVAIKRLHPHFAKDPEFVAMFLDEARVSARVRHPNVVPTLDVVALSGELLLVMEYIQGEALSRLVRVARQSRAEIPRPILSAILTSTLHGLHAAHEATSESGEPLGIVHRDVSPQNVLVDVHGVTRVVDFGIAKAAGRLQITREGQIKGKTAYMAPEQLLGGDVDRRVDVYAAGVMLWEGLTLERLFAADNEAAVAIRVLEGQVEPPSQLAADVPPALEAVVLRALARERGERFATAREMALALEAAVSPASPTEVERWIESLAGETLRERSGVVFAIESSSDSRAEANALLSSLGDKTSPDAHPPAFLDVAADSNAPAVVAPSATAPTQRSARRSAWPLLAGLVVLGALGVTVFALATRSGSTDEIRDAAPPTGATASATTAPGVSATSSSAAAGANSPPPNAASASATPIPTRPPKANASPARTPGTGKGGRPNCSPPYTIDRAGVHIPKPECL